MSDVRHGSRRPPLALRRHVRQFRSRWITEDDPSAEGTQDVVSSIDRGPLAPLDATERGFVYPCETREALTGEPLSLSRGADAASDVSVHLGILAGVGQNASFLRRPLCSSAD